MSFLFGQVNFRDERITEEHISSLYEPIKQFPHESYHTRLHENAGLGVALTFQTPESVYEQMPVYLSKQQVLFAAQGRIDNREHLAQELGISLTEQTPDGQLIQMAFQEWGVECVHHFLGDWSFAAYDIQSEELILARDKMGYTSLFYTIEDEKVVFSSSQKSILNLSTFKKVWSESTFLAHLILWSKPNSDPYEYFYCGLFSIPPAHIVSIKKGGVKEVKRYWYPENTPVQFGKSTQQYVDELSLLFDEAVRCRLRSYKPVAALLSGGLDSGSVVTVAAEQLKKVGQQITTFSHVPAFQEEMKQQQSYTRKILDEAPFILATAQKAGNVNTVLVDSKDYGVWQGSIDWIKEMDGLLYGHSSAFWILDITKKVSENKFGTLLTGEMGNATISFSGFLYLLSIQHPVFRGKWKLKIKEKLARPLFLKYKTSQKVRYDEFVNFVKENYLNEQLVKRFAIFDDMKRKDTIMGKYYSTIKEGMLDIIMLSSHNRLLTGAMIGQQYGINFRDPTGDVRVVEYCLSIPAEAWISEDGQLKNILKKMMAKRLPDDVLYANRSGLQGADLAFRLTQESKIIDTIITSLKEDSTTKEYFDLDKLENDWQSIKLETTFSQKKDQLFFKNLAYASFYKQMNTRSYF